jgi:hypothetical protein
MKHFTSCERCIFSDKADSSAPCKFNIIESIKDAKKLDIKNNYYYINNYVCRYGFAKTQEEQILKNFPDVDLMEYSRLHSYVRYYLVIDNLDNPDDIMDICNYIKKLAIKPKGISILTRQNNLPEIIGKYKEELGDSLLWKLHNFFDPTIDFAVGLDVALSTNNNLKTCEFLWLVNDKQLDHMINTKAIEQINYIINVMQPDIGILKSVLTNDNLSGLFLTKKNYLGLTKHIAPILNVALAKYIETESINLLLYDD